MNRPADSRLWRDLAGSRQNVMTAGLDDGAVTFAKKSIAYLSSYIKATGLKQHFDFRTNVRYSFDVPIKMFWHLSQFIRKKKERGFMNSVQNVSGGRIDQDVRGFLVEITRAASRHYDLSQVRQFRIQTGNKKRIIVLVGAEVERNNVYLRWYIQTDELSTPEIHVEVASHSILNPEDVRRKMASIAICIAYDVKDKKWFWYMGYRKAAPELRVSTFFAGHERRHGSTHAQLDTKDVVGLDWARNLIAEFFNFA